MTRSPPREPHEPASPLASPSGAARGVTLDTGALIGLERRKARAIHFLDLADQGLITLHAPGVVLTEWWRGPTEVRRRILQVVEVLPLTLAMHHAAGEALATVRGATAIDAMVMAFAASRGEPVLTGDVEDLERLRAAFPTVRVLGLSSRA